MSEAAALAAKTVVIREARDDDMTAVTEIYTHHVLHGLGSFEETPPDLVEMRSRRDAVLKQGLPYLIAELDRVVIGYAYAGLYRTRSAYRFAVEDSIYVSPKALRRGAGRKLLDALIERCTRLGYRQMLAVIGDSGNQSSIGVHAAAGFVQVGRLPSVGFKFGRWVDTVMMQRALGPGDTDLPPT